MYLIPLNSAGLGQFSDEDAEDTHGPGAVLNGCLHFFFFIVNTNEAGPSELSVELSEEI